VIAAGFDGGTPTYKPVSEIRRMTPPVETTIRNPVPTNEPPRQPQRKVLFDDVDVPEFLKNGS